MGALIIEKEKIQELLDSAPDNVVIDDFIDQIIISAKIEKALDQLANGQFLTFEQLDEEIEKWNLLTLCYDINGTEKINPRKNR